MRTDTSYKDNHSGCKYIKLFLLKQVNSALTGVHCLIISNLLFKVQGKHKEPKFD